MTCPICAKPTTHDYRPFCSRRCADLDLAKWLGGGYALPGERPEDQAEALPGERPEDQAEALSEIERMMDEDSPKPH